MFVVYFSLSILVLCSVLSITSKEWFDHMVAQLQLYAGIAGFFSGIWWLVSAILAMKNGKVDLSTLINQSNYWAASAAVISAALILGALIGKKLSKWIEQRREEQRRIADERIAAAIEELRS